MNRGNLGNPNNIEKLVCLNKLEKNFLELS